MTRKARQGMGEVSFGLQITLNDRARSYLAKMKNILLTDTQSICARLLRKLKGLFGSVDSREAEGFNTENSSGLNF